MLEFDDIPSDSGPNSSAAEGAATTTVTPAATSTHSKKPPNDPVHGSATNALGLGILHGCAIYVLAMHVLLYMRVRGRIV